MLIATASPHPMTAMTVTPPDHAVAHAHLDVRAAAASAVGPRAEADHPEALARLHLVAAAGRGTRCAGPPPRRSALTATRRRVALRCARSQRSFSSPTPPAGTAATKRPRTYATSTTRPPMGARFTCTSSGDRKIDTRTAGPTNGSSISSHLHHAPVGGRQHRPRHARATSARDRGRTRARTAATGRERRAPTARPPRRASASTSRQPRGQRRRTASPRARPGRALSRRPSSLPRRLDPRHHLPEPGPTSSIGCSASRLRMARKPARLAWFSSTHSRANWPDWISARIFFISAWSRRRSTRGPRV